MKKIIIISLIALLLPSCASIPPQETTVEIYSEGEELSGTLTISTEFAPEEYYGWYPLVEGFKKLHPNVEVIVEHTEIERLNQIVEDGIKFEQYRNDLSVSITAGNPPDLIFTRDDYASNFVPSEMIMDLNTFIEKDPSFKEEDFYMNVLDAFEIKDSLYTMPNAITYDLIRLRTDILENAGYEPDEIETVDYKLLLDVYNKAVDSGNFPELKSMVSGGVEGKAILWIQELASAFNPSEMTASFDSPEFIEYLETTRAYGGSPNPLGSIHFYTPFDEYLADKSYFLYYVMSYIGNTDESINEALVEKDGVTGIIPVTSAKGELYIKARFLMSIPKNAKNSSLAWEFIKYCIYESNSPSISYSSFTAGTMDGDRFEQAIPINKNNLSVMIDQYLPSFPSETRENYKKAFETPLSLPLFTNGLNVYLSDALTNSLWYDYYQTEGIATAEEVAKDMQEKTEIYFSEIK